MRRAVAAATPVYSHKGVAWRARSASLSFTTGSANSTQLIVSFTAECASDAANTSTFVDLDILVDGVPRSPTDQTFDAFCTSNGTAGHDGWVMAAVNAPVTLGPGNHTVQVRARSSNGTSGIWVSDSSTIVHN